MSPVEEPVLADREGPLGPVSEIPIIPEDMLGTAKEPLLVTAGTLASSDADDASFPVDRPVLSAAEVPTGSDKEVPTVSKRWSDTEEEAVLIAVEKLPVPVIGILGAPEGLPESGEEISLVAVGRLLD